MSVRTEKRRQQREKRKKRQVRIILCWKWDERKKGRKEGYSELVMMEFILDIYYFAFFLREVIIVVAVILRMR